MNNSLNIITLDIPFPPDYGGMIDTYYRIKTLHGLGVRIHLHCFEYGRRHSGELESLCETVSYYKRRSGLLYQFSLIPFVVSTRRSGLLLKNLLKNDYPILFDGLHTCFYINSPALTNRKKLVRTHNIEHNYYKSLAHNERILIRKFYYHLESRRLKWYEKHLKKADYILTISDNEQDYYQNRYNSSVLLAPFHPFKKPESLTGSGDYILFHGNLSVNENSVALESMISGVLSKISYRCIIAGKNPPQRLLKHASHYSNISVISNPEEEEMGRLISDAHIHLLPGLSSNGFKLKLLLALYAGRHCLINSAVVNGTVLASLCHVATSDEKFIEKIHQLMQVRFTKEMLTERTKILSGYFDNRTNGKKLINLIC